MTESETKKMCVSKHAEKRDAEMETTDDIGE